MLRLRLRSADLRRIRFADRLHPVGTALLASQALRGPTVAANAPALVDRVGGVTSGDFRAATAALAHLLPARGRLPDFLTPFDGLESLEAGLDAIRAVPARRVRADVTAAYAELPATSLRRRLAAADPEVFDLLVRATRTWFEAVLAPHWAQLVLAHQRQVETAAQQYASTGLDGLLDGLHPLIRWRAPVLDVETWWSGDLPGTGQGLILVPSPLAGMRPRVLVEPDRPVLLVYPVAVGSALIAAPEVDPLARLLGRTRAAVLRRLGEPGGHTTTTLARATGISLASASEHATALRGAGLLSTDRTGGAARHRLTPLGAHLLGAPPAA
ncbi:ArsR/SmtB family transcription factor [Micromonospora musae]|uniref:ArsR family transcriptional regulator n=1 Tax=Micromonospora musae TaxID=1894970 RepID=A0A3A9XT77_9ACTN|nr:helix-turn-helix domain-containing protein [Micromonospora musae]RKN28309.1 ArsR family transcriptional regulator [Micromonospora musae]